MDFGKSLCVLCRQPLATTTLVATPSDCPTHFFHFTCLAQHAIQDRRCPIDRIPFDNIVCDNGGPSGVSAPQQDEEKPKTDKTDGQKREEAGASSEAQVNVDGFHPSLVKMISSEKGDKHEKDIPQSACQSILIVKESTGQKPAPQANNPALLSTENSSTSTSIDCEICKSNSPGLLASPDCCVHWFHKACLMRYLDKHSVCPVKGCHREISTYMCSDGEVRRSDMTVESEYRNMVSAPDDFECKICYEADISRHRAVARPCDHMFHRACITGFVRDHKRCPVCQSPTTLVVCKTSSVGNLSFD